MSQLTNFLLRGLAGTGVRRVARPATQGVPAFQVSYVRTGPISSTPTVVIPGGPGLGSVLPYRLLRRLAVSGGLDLILIEHRGVGFSRCDVHGRPLTHDAMWVTAVLDDIAAVLDHEGVDRAYIAGSSYGSYVASAFGALFPERVAGMLLDSALQSTTDLVCERSRIRELFCAAGSDISRWISEVRTTHAIDERVLLDTVRAAYEFGGEPFLRALLKNRVQHRRSLTWWALSRYATRDESLARVPGFFEFDIAGAIGFRELEYASQPDGGPLDPALTYAPLHNSFPIFEGESFQLFEEVAHFHWPLVLLVGANDVRTPPAVAHRVAERAPQATIITIQNGHSALDTHPLAFLNAIRFLVSGKSDQLSALGPRFDSLPKRGLTAQLPRWLLLFCRLETVFRRRM